MDNKKGHLDKTIIIIQFKQRLGIHIYLTKSIVHILGWLVPIGKVYGTMFSKQRLMKFFKSYPILSIKKYNVILTDYVLQRLTLYKPLDDDNTMYAGEFKKTLGNKTTPAQLRFYICSFKW